MYKLTLLIALLLAGTANAQTAEQPYGNAERARTSARATDADLHKPVVTLGYLETNEATLQEFLDNLEAGLRAPGFPNSKIISFTIMVAAKGVDETRASEPIKGTRLPRAVFNQYHMDALKPGDKIYFEHIKVELNRNGFRTVAPIIITIR